MNAKTINDDVTMGGRASVLASRYRIIKQLGQGGMGSVWLAEDTQLDNKLFAIKMLPSILVSNKRAYNQLKSEALVAMKLVHPNIVQIRAFEENNGNPFLVMDYIDGETLDDWLGDRGQELGCRSQELGVSEEVVVKLLKPIAEALDYAHTEGVVHRDVKPANVMIRKDGRPFIMDFGIAREIQETLTRVTGKLSSGTLLYMSPEQLNGDMPKKEQDVYSFAAMVYECLKGEPPFCRGAIEDQIKNKTPEVLGDDITVASSVMAGLAKKPEERPKSCVEVLEKKFNRVERVDRVESGSSSIRRHLLSPSQGGGGVLTAPQIEELSSRAPQSNESPSEIGKHRGWKLLAAFVFLGFVVVYFGNQYRNNFFPPISDPPPIDTPNPLPPEKPISPTEVDVADIMVEATVKKNQLQRIDDADEFERRKAVLSDLLTKATAYGKAKQWDKAACNFTNYVDGCNKLITLDGERNIAKEKHSAALASQGQAEKVESSKYASARWGAALEVMKKANEYFSQMEFSEAKGFYESAANQFELCVGEAKTERERQTAVAKAPKERQTLEAIAADSGELLGWQNVDNKNPSAEESLFFTYVVRSGDSIFGILKKYRIKLSAWREIAKINNLTNGRISVGQRLKLPKSLLGSADREEKVNEGNVSPNHGNRKTLTLPGGATMTMIYVAPGSFMMGSPTTEEGHFKTEMLHHVILSNGYWLCETEVTQVQWNSVMTSNPSRFKGEDRPVECVSWNDCQEFVEKINAATNRQLGELRLPTEAEWEYACRAGSIGSYGGTGGLSDMGWYRDNSEINGIRQTHNVKEKRANAWGFFDMHGNVDEWCLEAYSTHPSLYVVRGGGWNDNPKSCRSAYRGFIPPGARSPYIGFRLACSVEPQKKIDSAARGESRHPISQSVSKVQLWEGGPYWADRNIGAEKPEDSGYYFWWGDTVGCKRDGDKWVASDGSNSNFSFSEVNTPTYNKDESTLQSEGWITADGVLSTKHDAAQRHWGGNWRMPTYKEFADLSSKCDWIWTQMDGVCGYVIRGKGEYSSKSIFLPLAGYGYGTSLNGAGSLGGCWSSVLCSGSNGALGLDFDSGTTARATSTTVTFGQSVRPLQGFTK